MPEPLNVLVVEDDLQLRDALCLTLECAGHRVLGAADGPAALRLLEREAFNLVVSDLRMQPMDGIELLRAIRANSPHLPVLLMTAFGDVDKAVSAMRAGACDFLLKPFEPRALLEHVARHAAQPAQSEGLIAADPRTKNLLALAARVARTDATVLLTGESGTGKEVFARYIHGQSPRHGAPFVAINCAAIPENLLEATLFGHEKGSFTGAQAAQAGKFEQAQGGTLLLDEISEMPLGLQAKLLRVLQEREVERVGGKKPVPLDIRVLATSNRNMAGEVAAGRFREDLFYRLNVFPIAIPGLRERPADILPLARYFLGVHGVRLGSKAVPDRDAEALLVRYGWPGNVRELENTMQRALILASGASITADVLRACLPADAFDQGDSGGSLGRTAPPGLQGLPEAAISAAPVGAQAQPVESVRPANMKDLEREHILTTLREVGGSRRRAVEKLGISERTLRYKLQQYRDEGYEI